ncbi:hypothetical protein C8E02_0930 [Vogesella indigofera]|uniref:Uncharacterized protein n=1 Tax=Vogesella indigofera TaxID=45465 RepID=A0A495BMB7_VOGIN|nr:hypothetical protein [Vogesella indigofera]RKQ61163.1 hypothetical protein C8E02_0930 [Vogesella indigofera]
MAKGDLLGQMDCPLCGTSSDVKEDKAGRPLLFCRHGCKLQLFTRTEAQADGMRRKLRPAAAPATTVPAAPEAAPAAPKPKSIFEQLTGIPA